MIDKLRSIAIFSTVVDQGSFRAAAQHLDLVPSRVSQVISDLEKDLGVTLLYRSTRQLSLTQQGRILLENAHAMLAAAENGLDAINPHAAMPVGALRVSVPAFIAQTNLMDTFATFATAYPKVSLDLHFTDSRKDLIKDGFDLAIRAGWLTDSELMTRKIDKIERFLVASVSYCATKPIPSRAEDLEEWDWIRFSMQPEKTELTSPEGRTVSVRGQAGLRVSSAEALYEFALRGMGLTSVPENLAQRGIERGELVHVLPNWTLLPLGIHAVWPDQSRRENLTTFFVRYLAEAKKR